MDALLFESSRPLRRQRKKPRREDKTRYYYFALQTWLLFFIAITIVQMIMSSYWVPAITDTAGKQLNDIGSITRSTSSSRGDDIDTSIIKKDNTGGVLRYHDYEGSNSVIDNDDGAAISSADDVFYSERNTDNKSSTRGSSPGHGTKKERDKIGEIGKKEPHTKREDRKKKTTHSTAKNDSKNRDGQSISTSQTIKEVSLDNYYSREHINKSVAKKRATKKPILVVGGSDGSGTRAFVDMLIRMGVPFVVDDKGTKDVHGQEMFNKGGWPPLAKMVLEATHSADYEIDDLPKQVRDQAIAELQKLKQKLDSKATAIHNDKREKKKKDPKVEDWAQLVNYGFKAPVTMLLLPLLREVFGPIKFLHVVRDGRDMALSNNISPVVKFYDSYYKDSTERRAKLEANNGITNEKDAEHVLSMHLWNDWNTEVLSFNRNHTNGESFDYLVVRTEDFVHPDTKYESLLRLSDFVGSHKKDDELCCLSREAVADMGASVRTAAEKFKKKEQQKQSKQKTTTPKGGGGSGLGPFIDTLREEEEALDHIAQTLEEEVKSIQKITQALHAQEDILEQEMERTNLVDDNSKILDFIFYLLGQMSSDHRRGDDRDREFSDIMQSLTDGSEGGKDMDQLLVKLLGTTERARGSRVHYEEKDELIGEIVDALKGPKKRHPLSSRYRSVLDDDDASDDSLEDLLAGLIHRKKKRMRQPRYRYMDDQDGGDRDEVLGELLGALQRPKRRHSRTQYADDEDAGADEILRRLMDGLTRPSNQPAPTKKLRKRTQDIIDDDVDMSLLEKLSDVINSSKDGNTKHTERDEDDLAVLLSESLGNRRLSESEMDADEDAQGNQIQRRRHLFSSHPTHYSTRQEGNGNHLKTPTSSRRRLTSASFTSENPMRRRLTATKTTSEDNDLISVKPDDRNNGLTHQTANEPMPPVSRRKQKERRRRHRDDKNHLRPDMKRSHGNHRDSTHTPYKSSRDYDVDRDGGDNGDEVARSRALGFPHHKREYENQSDDDDDGDDDDKKDGSTTSTEEETRRAHSSNKLETRDSRGQSNGEQGDIEDMTIHHENLDGRDSAVHRKPYHGNEEFSWTKNKHKNDKDILEEETVRSNMSNDALLDSNLVESTSGRHGESIEHDHGSSDTHVNHRRKQSSNQPAKTQNVESMEHDQGSSTTAISHRREQSSNHPAKRQRIGRDGDNANESQNVEREENPRWKAVTWMKNLAERDFPSLHEELDHVDPLSENRKSHQHTERKPVSRTRSMREQPEQVQTKEEQLEEEWSHEQNQEKQVAQDWETEQQIRRQKLQQQRQKREQERKKRPQKLQETRRKQEDQHTRGGKTQKDQRKKVEGRFGKWIAALKDQPELSALLHSEGAQGLKLFGYEPSVRFSDASPDSCKCDEAVVCDAKKEPQQPKHSKSEQPPKTSPQSKQSPPHSELSEQEMQAAKQMILGEQEQEQIMKEMGNQQQQLDSVERQRLQERLNILEEREKQYMKTFGSDKEMVDALVLALEEIVSSPSGDPEAKQNQMEHLKILQGRQREFEASPARIQEEAQRKEQQEVIQQIRELRHQQVEQVREEILAEINDKSLTPTRRHELMEQVEELNDLQNYQILLMEDLQERLLTLREQQQEAQRQPEEEKQPKQQTWVEKSRKEEADIAQKKPEEHATQQQIKEEVHDPHDGGYLRYQDGDEYIKDDDEHQFLLEATEEKKQSHPAQAPKVSPSTASPSEDESSEKGINIPAMITATEPM